MELILTAAFAIAAFGVLQLVAQPQKERAVIRVRADERRGPFQK